MSNSSNNSMSLQVALQREAFRKYQLVPSSIIVIVGFVANVMVIHAGVKKSSRLKYTTNSFILNLAVADLGMILIFIPIQYVEYTVGLHIPDWTCKYLIPIRETFSIMSIISVAGLGMVRFLQIHRARVLLSMRLTNYLIAVTWVVAYLTISLPLSLVIHHTKENTCDHSWRSEELKKVHVTFLNFILIIPLLITTLCNFCIIRNVRNLNREFSGSKRSEMEQKSQKISILLFMLIVTAWMSLGPFLVYSSIAVYTNYYSTFPYLMWSIMFVLLTSSSAINPLLVLIMNKDYRHEIRRSFYKRERICPLQPTDLEIKPRKHRVNNCKCLKSQIALP